MKANTLGLPLQPNTIATGRLVGREYWLPLRVYYEDTDAAGVVYHANYLRFAERGRSEFLRHLGFDQLKLQEDLGVVFVVARAEIAFLAPARLDDVLNLGTRLKAINLASIVTEQRLLVQSREVARLTIRTAIVTSKGRAVRVPTALRHVLAPFCDDLSSPLE